MIDHEDEELPPVLKSAIAYCLDEDQRKLYGLSYIYYADPLIKEWVEYYMTLDGQIKQMADSEIYHFHNYLLYTSSTQPEKYERDSAQELFLQQVALMNRANEMQPDVVKKEGLRKRQEWIDASRKAQDTLVKVRKKAKELRENTDVDQKREEWLELHFLEYMSGYFVRHPISLMADGLKSDLEYKVRQDAIYAMNMKLDRPSVVLGFYVAALDLVYAAKDESHFYKLYKQLANPANRHPIARYAKTIYRGEIMRPGVASFAHPLDGKVVEAEGNISPEIMKDGKVSEFEL